jgi:hypothetical protein
LNFVHIVLLAARFIYLFIYSLLLFLLKHSQKNKTFNKHLTSKLQFSPKFTLNSVADSNYRGKCDVGGFLIFEWTLNNTYQYNMISKKISKARLYRLILNVEVGVKT